MNTYWKTLTVALTAFAITGPSLAGQYMLELVAPLEKPSEELLASHQVTLDETLSAGEDSYAVFSASDATALGNFLSSAGIDTEKISEVLFVNSPIVSGSDAVGPELKDGHQVYVIERPIPGVGFFGFEKKKNISKGSVAAIKKIGSEAIEWDHSYLTAGGTYCVYRADSPETIREHGLLAGAPIEKITLVSQRVF